MKKERIIYLMSGPLKRSGFTEKIKESLKKTLEDKKIITFIASTPDDYEKNDKYVNGNNNDIPGIKKFIREISNIEIFNTLDNRITTLEGIKILNNSDVIYLLGGNPITQIKFLKENGYDKIIKNFNGVILGTSAGAMNLLKIAYYSKDEDYDKSFFYEGLGLIDITIDPHFDIEDKVQVQEAINNSTEKQIIGITDESALIIRNDLIIEIINDCYIIENGIINNGKNERRKHHEHKRYFNK